MGSQPIAFSGDTLHAREYYGHLEVSAVKPIEKKFFFSFSPTGRLTRSPPKEKPKVARDGRLHRHYGECLEGRSGRVALSALRQRSRGSIAPSLSWRKQRLGQAIRGHATARAKRTAVSASSCADGRCRRQRLPSRLRI